MTKCKTKAIQTNLDTFRHNQAYPGIIQAYSGKFRTLCYPEIFKTVVHPEPWHIQNQKHIQNLDIFRMLAYSKSEAYSVPCQTSTMKCFANGYNYFHKL